MVIHAPPSQFAFIQSQTAQILSHPTWDVVLLLLLLAGGFFYGIAFGRHRVIANILYTYAAFAIALALPLDSIISSVKFTQIFFAKSIILLFIFVFLSLLLGGRKRRWFNGINGPWWQTFTLSILQVGLLMHFMLQFLPPSEIARLAPLTKRIIADPALHIWWVLLPIGFLVLFRRVDAHDGY